MQLTPLRAFTLGAVTVLALAGAFVAGIGVGASSDGSDEAVPAGLAAKADCPSPPGFTATKAANDLASNCEVAAVVEQMLVAAGADGANVQVSQVENGTLLGPERMTRVIAQVYLPNALKGRWDAAAAARAISTAVGTTPDAVVITDDELRTLYDATTATAGPTMDRPRATPARIPRQNM